MKKIITLIFILSLTISTGITAQLHLNSDNQVITWGGKHPDGLKEGHKMVKYDGKHPHYRKENKGNPDKQNITNYKYKDGELIFNPSGNKKRIKREKEQVIEQKIREMAIQKIKNNGNWKDVWEEEK